MFAISALFVAGVSFADAVASIAWRSNPDLALKVHPGEAQAWARKGEIEILAIGEKAPGDLKHIDDWMRRSLAAAPLQARALRVSGTSAELSGEESQASLRLRLADRVSRRDILTQLWALEDAVARNDTAGALRRYDLAIRIKPDTQQLLFPILANALTDPAIRADFYLYSQKSLAWVAAFYDYAATHGDHPEALVTFFRLVGPEKLHLADDLPSKLLTRLLAAGDFNSSNQFLQVLRRYDIRLLGDASINGVTTDAGLQPITWAPMEQAGASARLDGQGRQFRIVAEAGVAGQILRRFMSLPPGRYTFGVRREIASAGLGATENWTISCLRNGQFVPEWKSRSPTVADRPINREELILPADCSHQYVTLSVSGGADAVLLDYTLTSISLESVSSTLAGS